MDYSTGIKYIDNNICNDRRNKKILIGQIVSRTELCKEI